MMAWMVEATQYPFGYVKPPEEMHIYNEKTGERIRYIPEVMHITTGEPEHIYESETCGGEITAAIEPREEIIRCRDCKHLSKEPIHEYSWGDKDYWCSNHDNYVWVNEGEQPDGFCAWAERA